MLFLSVSYDPMFVLNHMYCFNNKKISMFGESFSEGHR